MTFAPQLPADWDRVQARGISVGDARYDLTLERAMGRATIKVERRIQVNVAGAAGVIVAPAFPLDARIRSVAVNGNAVKFDTQRMGDVQRIEVNVNPEAPISEIVFTYDEGTDVYVERESLRPGAGNEGLRVLSSHAEANALRLRLEGLGGRTYELRMRTQRRVGEASGVKVGRAAGSADQQLSITFDGPQGTYVRREVIVPMLAR